MNEFKTVGVVGGGLIGMSWASLFLAKGCDVVVIDPDPDAAKSLDGFLPKAWANLTALGLANRETAPVPMVTDDYSALLNVDFIQENGPERLDAKLAIIEELEAFIRPEVIIASSTSSLCASDMQTGARVPKGAQLDERVPKSGEIGSDREGPGVFTQPLRDPVARTQRVQCPLSQQPDNPHRSSGSPLWRNIAGLQSDRWARHLLRSVNAFWSITMYRMPEILLVDNPIDRYLLNSTMLGDFILDPDGGLTLLIQHASSGTDLEANWLPTPEGWFLTVIRLYWPQEAAFDGSWNPPAIVRVE
jgi:hypothetical protein